MDEAANIHTWTVVLGDTSRTEPVWPAGTAGSPLSQTLDLALSITDPRRIVTPMTPDGLMVSPLAHPALTLGRVLREPLNRGTACSLLLALCHIRAEDPDAQIVVLPTDHFVHPAHAFGRRLSAALDAARRTDCIVILGVTPTSLETRHGWVLPGSPMAHVSQLEVRRVETFIEHPSRDLAALIKETGGLWSTMILAAPLGRLWASARRSLPEIATALEPVAEVSGWRDTHRRDHVYAGLPRRSIASHLLHRLGEGLVVAELDCVSWCDWDCSRRILDALPGEGPTLSAESS